MRYWRRRGNIGEKEKKFGEENNGEEEKTLGEKRECKRKRGTVGEEEREDGGSGAGRRAGSAVWARAKGGGQGGAGGGRGGPTSPIRRRCPRCPPPAAGMQGMELCAVAVVILLFIAVLKQFGILEPISVEGNPDSPPSPRWHGGRFWGAHPTPPVGDVVCVGCVDFLGWFFGMSVVECRGFGASLCAMSWPCSPTTLWAVGGL